MTWSNNAPVVDTIVKMMMGSRDALVSYQTPLGIAHQFNSTNHYGRTPPSGSPNGNIDTTPENLLAWWMRETWDSLQPFFGARRFGEVKAGWSRTRQTPRTGATP